MSRLNSHKVKETSRRFCTAIFDNTYLFTFTILFFIVAKPKEKQKQWYSLHDVCMYKPTLPELKRRSVKVKVKGAGHLLTPFRPGML